MNMPQWLALVRDFLFPLADPPSATYVEKRKTTLADDIAAIPSDEATLQKYTRILDTSIETEEKRRQSVESRLRISLSCLADLQRDFGGDRRALKTNILDALPF